MHEIKIMVRVVVFIKYEPHPDDGSYLRNKNFTVYDHMLPFREAARFIMRGNDKSRLDPEKVETFANTLVEPAERYFYDSKDKRPWAFRRFAQWYKNQREFRDAVAILGLHNAWDRDAINLLENCGAVIEYVNDWETDFHSSCIRDAKRFVLEEH